MRDSTLDLKAVSELLPAQGKPSPIYKIPAYQRGYRWSPFQVTQLLDDIWDFVEEGEDGCPFYCLQPLVVRKDRSDDGNVSSFEIVDGQQRLTTIYIILTCLEEMVAKLGKARFRLTFETRGEANERFLDQIDLQRDTECIDFYHICEAYRAVQKWCETHPPEQQFKLLEHLLNNDSGRNVRVIWFELGDNDNPVNAFTRLNVGKIRLTNDELIRALFLGRGRQEQTGDDSLKVQIACEWDLFEKELRSEDFWAFLTDDTREQNRIGFLFELIAEADGIPPEFKDDEYKVFYSFNKKLSDPRSTPEKEWLKIKQEFMRLQEWFEDERRITYHIVGFLVTQGVKLHDIRRLSEGYTKREFDRRLRDRTYQCLIGNKVSAAPPEPELRSNLTAFLDGLEYGNAKIRAVLLLFNIATLLEHEESNVRFQFDAFRKTQREIGWDLEHIRSRAADSIKDTIQWLSDCLYVLDTLADHDAEAATLVAKTKAYLATDEAKTSEDDFAELRNAILRFFHEADDQEERNDLANLTLLDSSTNRGYKNAPFAVKRQKILLRDKAGVFIPLCTRNVFLKAYSTPPGNLIIWTDEDGEAYRTAITDTLISFFLGDERPQ